MSVVEKTNPPDMNTVAAETPAKPSGQHLCCLCSVTLPSKEELQDHFRFDCAFMLKSN